MMPDINEGGKSMDELVFLGVCGSLRRASRNRGLLRKARELMPAGSRLDIADISALPFFNEDIPKPESVRRLVGLAENADGFLFASPEYN